MSKSLFENVAADEDIQVTKPLRGVDVLPGRLVGTVAPSVQDYGRAHSERGGEECSSYPMNFGKDGGRNTCSTFNNDRSGKKQNEIHK